jgi:hypothetical protein
MVSATAPVKVLAANPFGAGGLCTAAPACGSFCTAGAEPFGAGEAVQPLTTTPSTTAAARN